MNTFRPYEPWKPSFPTPNQSAPPQPDPTVPDYSAPMQAQDPDENEDFWHGYPGFPEYPGFPVPGPVWPGWPARPWNVLLPPNDTE